MDLLVLFSLYQLMICDVMLPLISMKLQCVEMTLSDGRLRWMAGQWTTAAVSSVCGEVVPGCAL